jgi:alpha-ketoglutarate-dependent taurine dioxygenase
MTRAREGTSTTADEVVRSLNTAGVFVGYAPSLDAILDLARTLGALRPHRDAGPRRVTDIRPDQRQGPTTDGFSRKALPLHTDGSAVPIPPALVISWFEAPADRGGETLLADMQATWPKLTPPERLAFLDPNGFEFGHGRLVSGLLTPRGGRLVLRYRDDGLIRPRGPLQLQALERLRPKLARACYVLAMKRNDFYVVDNFRVMHGRRRFDGERVVKRVLVDSPSLELGVQTDT